MHGLNPQQSAAVLHVEGPLLVLAGAGSGKTRVIVEKIAYLIGSGRMPARRIAAITFTNKSAREMKERVARRLKGDAAEGLTVCTFHALGLKILQLEHAKLGLRRGFSIFDAEDSAAQFKDLLPPGSKPDAIEAAKQLEQETGDGDLKSRLAQAGLELDERRLHEFEVVRNAEVHDAFVAELRAKLCGEFLAMNRLHDQNEVRPFQKLRCNRRLRVAIYPSGRCFDAFPAREDMLSRWAAQPVLAADE